MVFPLGSIAGGRDASLSLGPKSQAWVERTRKLPAYVRGEARMKTEEASQKKETTEE
jgi:hypothetical protein